MKKKALALAVAGAFFAPASYAAQGADGMQYTSAAEGFYGSLRARFRTEGVQNGGAGLDDGAGASLGVRGSHDLGNGLSGFYQYEFQFNNNEASALNSKVAHVGLEGAFGRVWAGTGSVENYGMVYGVSDVANISSGNFVTNRQNQVLQYRTPDISGFQGALALQMSRGMDNGNPSPGDDNNVDTWYSSARYSVQGFTGAFSYIVEPDQVMNAVTEDRTEWAARLSYAQDNWSVGGWYGKRNDSDFNRADDEKTMSIAGSVSVNKVGLYAVYEQQEAHDGNEDAFTTLGINYQLGSKSKVWMEYAGRDQDSAPTHEDYVNVGLRHDF